MGSVSGGAVSFTRGVDVDIKPFDLSTHLYSTRTLARTAMAEAGQPGGPLIAQYLHKVTELEGLLALGADIVIASDTKTLSGHSDLLLGHVSVRDRELAQRLQRARTLSGSIPGPFEAWLAHRSMGTLDLRLARQVANAEALVRQLHDHPAVSAVRWPGTPDDPSHGIARRQMRRWGGVFGFELADRARVERFLRRSHLLVEATSFGGLHSTVDRRAQWGDAVPEGFVRFSAGCEDTRDLVTDTLQALDGE